MKMKTTEQLTKDLENIIKRLYKNEDIETVKKIVEKVLLQTEMDKNDSEKKPDNSKKARIIELLRDLKGQEEVKDECQCSLSYVSITARENKIYSRRRVTILIKNRESPEKIAEEGNVSLDAVVKLQKKLEEAEKSKPVKEKKKRGRKPDEQKRRLLIEAAKNLETLREIGNIAQFNSNYAKKILDEEGIYTRAKVKQLLNSGMSPEEIAREGNINLDAVIKLSEKIETKKQEELKKKKNSQISDKVVNMAANLISPKEIMATTGMGQSNVYKIIKSRGIYPVKEVTKLIRLGRSPEDIAQEGNVNLDAVVKLQKKLEEAEKNKPVKEKKKRGKKPDEQKRKLLIETDNMTVATPEAALGAQSDRKDSKLPKQYSNTTDNSRVAQINVGGRYEKGRKEAERINATILRMARQIKSVDKMVSALGVSEYTIRNKLRVAGIYTREQVIALVKSGEKTDEEIAGESSTDVREVKAIHEKMLELSMRLKRDKKLKIALKMLEEGSSISAIRMQTKKNMEELEILKELFVEPKEKPISPEKRIIEFKIEMMQLTSSIKLGTADTRISREVNEGRIQKILYKYHELLTPEDYACMAYAYTKTGDYVKAIELAEEHLGLETPSLNGLKEKIQDVLGVGKEERISEEQLSSKVVSQYTKPKAGKAVGGDDSEHSGR